MIRSSPLGTAIYTALEWRQQGQPTADARLRAHTRELLEGLEPPEDHDELVARGEEFIRSLEI